MARGVGHDPALVGLQERHSGRLRVGRKTEDRTIVAAVGVIAGDPAFRDPAPGEPAAIRYEAAPILERGKAQVEVLRRLYAEVQTGGDAAFAVFMAEKLPELLEIAVGAVEGVDIDRVVVMDGG
ncbi:hypothetical protein [Candidatus Palauibacter sp.]|uniref:hypothetical protein n=1 Tax=Candidatus Palauibacter sp. TaxID=3101350 RepID=UPI003AF3026C